MDNVSHLGVYWPGAAVASFFSTTCAVMLRTTAFMSLRRPKGFTCMLELRLELIALDLAGLSVSSTALAHLFCCLASSTAVYIVPCERKIGSCTRESVSSGARAGGPREALVILVRQTHGAVVCVPPWGRLTNPHAAQIWLVHTPGFETDE